MSVAGYDDVDSDIDMSNIADSLSMLYQPDLRIPLRSTREVLDMAGMADGTSADNLTVAAFSAGNAASYTIPPLLMPGLPGYKVRVVDRNNNEEVVTAVKNTREHVSTRTGARGVPVLCNSGYGDYKTIFSWVREGLAMADIPGVTMDQTNRVICYSAMLGIPGQVGEDVVADWLDGLHKGEEERDLLTDQYCSRGWEAMSLIVVDLGGAGGGVENLVMRGRTYVALVTDQDTDSDSDGDTDTDRETHS